MKKSLQLMASLVLVISLLITCTNDDGNTVPNNKEINLAINFAGLNLQTSNLSGKSATSNKSQEISDWVHIFEADLTLEFTNTTTNTVFSLSYNPSTPQAVYKIILPFGTYNYKLESTGETYSDYIPFIAQGTIEISTQKVNLELVGITEYGLVTVDMFHIPTAVIEDIELGTIEMASSQDHFYKYVKSEQQPLVKITEDILNTEPIYQLESIAALVRYNLMLGVDELNVISFILSDFEQQDLFFEIDPNAARTYVPDDNFEQWIIDLGLDDILDDYVLTSNIVGVEYLCADEYTINDFTGIGDFVGLKTLCVYWGDFESIDLSNNLNLQRLTLQGESLLNIDLSKNINLESLDLWNNQLTSLDVSNNTALTTLNVRENPLICIQVNETQLNAIPSGWSKDAGASYSLDCSFPTDGLVAYYPFNGNANDESGNGNHGTVVGSVSLSSDRFNNTNSSYSFPGLTDSYIDVNQNSSFSNFQEGITLSVWTKYNYHPLNSRLIEIGNTDGGAKGFNLASNSPTNEWYSNAFGDGGGITIISDGVIIDTWTHVVVTYNFLTGNSKSYINGELIIDNTPNSWSNGFGIWDLSDRIFNIGRKTASQFDPWNGKIDDIGIWNRALNESEIQYLYNN